MSFSKRSESGLSLIEVVVAMMISGVIMAVLVNVLVGSTRSARDTSNSIQSSTSAFRASTYFANDVATAGVAPGSTQPVSRAVNGCGGTTAVVRIVGPGQSSGTIVRSYHQISTAEGSILERRVCSGTDLNAALGATHTDIVVAKDLNSSPVQISCSGDSPTPPFDDSGCTSVELTATTTTTRVLTAKGRTRSAQSPTATTAVAPPTAPATGTCTLLASDTAYTGTGSGSNSTHANQPQMPTYNRFLGFKNYSYLRFDLTGPCTGAGDPWPTLPGGRTIVTASLSIGYLGTAGCCISYKEHSVTAVGPGTWSEATLTGNNRITGTLGSAVDFDAPGSNPTNVNLTGGAITTAVQQWYTPGGWKNNGFVLARRTGGDTTGKTRQWATRLYGNATYRPRLVVTWGP